MRTIGIHTRFAWLFGAMALLVQISPALASDQNHDNRPVEITFTKWGAAPPAVPPTPFFGLFDGFAGDGILGSFNAEVLWRQVSVNGHVPDSRPCTRWWTGTVRSRHLSGAGRIRLALACSTASSWPGGEPARGYTSSFRGISPAEGGCAGAPVGKNSFEGIIYVGAPPGLTGATHTALMQGYAKEIALRICPGEEVG